MALRNGAQSMKGLVLSRAQTSRKQSGMSVVTSLACNEACSKRQRVKVHERRASIHDSKTSADGASLLFTQLSASRVTCFTYEQTALWSFFGFTSVAGTIVWVPHYPFTKQRLEREWTQDSVGQLTYRRPLVVIRASHNPCK